MNEDGKSVKIRITKENIRLAIEIISVIAMVTFGIIAWNQADRANKLQSEMSNILKPSIIKTEINVEGGSKGYSFPIYINNPSDTQYFIDFPNSLCYYNRAYMINQTNYTSSTNLTNITNQSQFTTPSLSFPLGIFFPKEDHSINPHQVKTIYCPDFTIFNVTNVIKTDLRVCIKLEKISDRICEDLDVNIVPSNRSEANNNK